MSNEQPYIVWTEELKTDFPIVSAQPNINFEQIKSLLIPMPLNDAGLAVIVEECRKNRLEVSRLRRQA
jgi:uncharacterized protein YqiB (DUF1249 family)